MAQPHLIFADCRGLFRHKHLLTTVLFLLTIYFRFRYKDDLDAERLRLHRDMFLDIARQRNAELASFRDALTVFRSSGAGQDAMRIPELLPELAKLFCVALTIPVTTSTAERSFSTLRRLKTCLRSTMTQERLNHVAILHVHKSVCGELDLDAVANDFFGRCSVRQNTSHV